MMKPNIRKIMELLLKVDDKTIPTNTFVKEFLCNMLAGALGTLHGVGTSWKKIEITVEK